MPPRPHPKIPPELLDRILRTLIWKLGLEALQKPTKELTKRIEEGWKRFLWDLDVRAARGLLDQLAGCPSLGDLLASIPFELPDLRKSKPVLSRIKLKAEYNMALDQAKIAFRFEPRTRSGVRIDTPMAALGTEFPDVPRRRFDACKTPRAAALEVVKFRFADYLSPATVGHLVNSRPKNRQVALDHERRAADPDPDLMTAIRMELAKDNLKKQVLDLK